MGYGRLLRTQGRDPARRGGRWVVAGALGACVVTLVACSGPLGDRERGQIPELRQELQGLRADVVAVRDHVRRLEHRVGEIGQQARSGKDGEPTKGATRPADEGAVPLRIQNRIADLGSRNLLKQYQAALDLKQMGPAAVPALVEALRHEQSRVRRGAAAVLAELREPSAVPGIMAAFRAASGADDKLVIAAALGRLRDPRAVPLLIEELKSGDWRLQTVCAKALGRLGDARAVPALVALLSSANANVKRSAQSALKHLGPGAVPALAKAFGSASGEAKVLILAVFEDVGDTRSILELQKGLDDANTFVRLASARSLARLGRTDGLAVVNDARNSQSRQAREFATEIIRLLGHRIRYDRQTSRFVPARGS